MADDARFTEWVRTEQGLLWDDLHAAIRAALNGAWSMHAGHVASRIVGAARLVGPTSHGALPWPLVAGGVYEAVLAAGGVTPDLPADDAEWQRLDAMMTPRTGTRAELRARYAATVAAIRADAASIAATESPW